MKRINPHAIAVWVCMTAGGFLLGDLTGAVAGLAVAAGLSVLAGLFL